MQKEKILLVGGLFLVCLIVVVVSNISTNGFLNIANPLEKSEEAMLSGNYQQTDNSFDLEKEKNSNILLEESNLQNEEIQNINKIEKSSDSYENKSFASRVSEKIINLFRKSDKSTPIKIDDSIKDLNLDCRTGSLPCGVVVETGEYFSCAVIAGEIKCWGDNRAGQLGDGTVGGFTTTPQIVPGITDAIDVATGNLHTCAIRGTGEVWCWGQNNEGQIGNGTQSVSISTPTQVAGITNAIAITAGDNHTCALLSTGQMMCWGWNRYGQLGNGTTNSSLTPVNVIANIAQISAGTLNTCAISNTGQAYCWGDNQYGELGNGTIISQANPVLVFGMTNAKQITTADNHTCAILVSGQAQCFGNNKWGQIGNGTFGTINSTPQNVLNVSNVTFISSKFSHTCLVEKVATSEVSISCFGEGYNGALGNGMVNDSNIPVFAIQNYSCCGWESMSTINQPSERNNNSLIWTNTEMIIWGGEEAGGIFVNNGARYNL